MLDLHQLQVVAFVKASASLAIKIKLNQHTLPILATRTPALARRNLRRRPRVTGRHIQARIPHEEVSRPQQQRHWFRRHDGKVLWRWEVGDAKGVP